MSIEIYWNALDSEAHLKLNTWKDFHEDEGLVLNRKSREVAVIHRAWCRHLKHSIPSDLTNKPKICSTNRRELEAWWARESKVPMDLCGSCEA